MESSNNDSYVLVVGEFLSQHLIKNPQDSTKIMNPDKTIKKSLDEMEKNAKRVKVGNRAMLTPQQTFDIVMKYFGIEGLTYGEPSKVISRTKFKVNLDDLL